MFWIKRDNVVFYDVSHRGMSNYSKAKHTATKQPVYVLRNPETGKYQFTLYTANKFENPVKEIIVVK